MSEHTPRAMRRYRAELIEALERDLERRPPPRRLRTWAIGAAVVVLGVVSVIAVPRLVDEGDGGALDTYSPTTVTSPNQQLGDPEDLAPYRLAENEPGDSLAWDIKVDGEANDPTSRVRWICWHWGDGTIDGAPTSGGCAERENEAQAPRVFGSARQTLVMWQVPSGTAAVDLVVRDAPHPLTVARHGDLTIAYGRVPKYSVEATLVAHAADGSAIGEHQLVARPVPDHIGETVDVAVRPGDGAWPMGTSVEFLPDTPANGDLSAYVVESQDPPPGTTDLSTGQITLVARRPIIGGVPPTDGFTIPRGTPAVLIFHSDECIPCRELISLVSDWSTQHPETDVVVIDHDARRVAEFPEEWRVVVDDDGSLREAYGVAAVPTLFLVSEEGLVVATSAGLRPEFADEFDAALAAGG